MTSINNPMHLYSEVEKNILNPAVRVGDESNIYPFWQDQRGRTFKIPGGYITVVHPGEQNYYSGPDFRNCVLRHSGGRIFQGDVEIHSTMQDWHAHQHSHCDEYRNLILHVIVRGIPDPIRVNEVSSVPTILLHLPHRSSADPCVGIIHTIEPDDLSACVKTMARIRWDRVREGLSGPLDQTLFCFFKLISIRGNKANVQTLSGLFIRLHENQTALVTLLRIMDKKCRSLPWRTGKRRPASHPVNRIPFVSLVAFMYLTDLREFLTLDMPKMEDLRVQLRQLGYPVPGKIFMTEMMGNIILPLFEVLTGKDHFHQWATLKVQPYAGVRQRLAEWKWAPEPLLFEQQQGILQIDKDACQGRYCALCPVALIAGTAGIDEKPMTPYKKRPIPN